jgi:hypothetical protein
VAFASFTYGNQQARSRDARRAANATIIAEALEQYYDRHGEYPAMPQLDGAFVANTGDAVAGRLQVDAEVLVMPRSPSNVSNAIRGTDSSDDILLYVGQKEGDTTSCTASSGGGCDEFILSYKEEATGDTVTLRSRRSGNVSLVPEIDAPPAPNLTTSVSGNTVTATASVVSCPTGFVAHYGFRANQNDSQWTDYTEWTTTRSVFVTASQGYKYGFQVRVRCQSDGANSKSGTSDIAYYTHPISAPAAPTISVTVHSTWSEWSWNSVTCPEGTSAAYSRRWHRDDLTGWRDWSTFTFGTLSFTLTDHGSQGFEYSAQVRAMCSTSYADSDYSPISNTASYYRDIDTPGVASSYSHTVAADRKSRRFEWIPPTCGPGTRAEFRRRGWLGEGGWVWTSTGTNGWTEWNDYGFFTPGTTYSPTNPDQTYPAGIEVRIDVQYRCLNNTTDRSVVGPTSMSPIFVTD